MLESHHAKVQGQKNKYIHSHIVKYSKVSDSYLDTNFIVHVGETLIKLRVMKLFMSLLDFHDIILSSILKSHCLTSEGNYINFQNFF